MFEYWRFIGVEHTLGTPMIASYNFPLVVLSVAVASLGASTAFAVVDRVIASKKPSVRKIWILTGAIAMGCGIWAMHFIAMLAMSMPVKMSFGLSTTMLSIVPAIFGSGIALFVMSHDKIAIWRLQFCSLLMAVGIGTMHYLGMEGIQSNVILRYDFKLFILSILFAHILASVALYIKFFIKNRFVNRGFITRLASATVMGLAISGMHYIAMQSAMFFPSQISQVSSLILPPIELAIFIGIITTLIIGFALVGTLVDRKLSEVSFSLTESEQFSRLLLESAGEGICGIDQEGSIIFINPAAAKMLGYNVTDLIDCPIQQVFHGTPNLVGDKDSEFSVKTDVKEIDTQGIPVFTTFVRKDKKPFAVEFTSTAINMHGSNVGRVITFRDITERQQAEIALRESEEKFRQIIEQTKEVLWLCSPDGKKLIYVSPAYEKIAGRSCENFYQQPNLWLDFIHPEDRTRMTNVFFQKAMSGQEYSEEYRILKQDKSVSWLADHVFPIHDVGGKIKYIAGFTQDVTERRNMEVELRFSQKLEAVGHLAAGMAHEINTPTQYVGDNIGFLQSVLTELIKTTKTYAELLKAGKADQITAELISQIDSKIADSDIDYLLEEAPKALVESQDGIRQIAKIVQAMKEFSHPGGENKEFADINSIIENTAIVARSEWKYCAKLEHKLDTNIPKILCFPQVIGQVILNLIVNSSHAIKEKLGDNPKQLGLITITSKLLVDQVEISVKDTGNGIPRAIREKIFDPFFTTKDVGQGTGQGLAMARTAIIDGHGGSIQLETELGKGTCFLIRLSTEPMIEKHTSQVT